MCRGIEELELLQSDFHSSHPSNAVQPTKSLLNICSEFLKYPSYKAATFVLLWRLFSMVPRKACFAKGEKYNEDPRCELFELLKSRSESFGTKKCYFVCVDSLY